jgi:hypothetical protein
LRVKIDKREQNGPGHDASPSAEFCFALVGSRHGFSPGDGGFLGDLRMGDFDPFAIEYWPGRGTLFEYKYRF